MKFYKLAFVGIALPIMLVGCGASVPDCGDSDAKDLVFDIARDNYFDSAMQQVNAQITGTKNRITELPARMRVADIKVAVTAEKRQAELDRLASEINEIETFVGHDGGSDGLSEPSRFSVSVSNYWNKIPDTRFFNAAYENSDTAKLAELNALVGLPADNIDPDLFSEARHKLLWGKSKYADGNEIEKAWREFRSQHSDMRELNPAVHKREVDAYNVRIKQEVAENNAAVNKRIAEEKQELVELQATADYLQNGKFSLHTIRTLGTDEQTGKRACNATLEFTHADATHSTDIEYWLEVTSDDLVYAEVQGLQNPYGI